jgi:hypothetical protein
VAVPLAHRALVRVVVGPWRGTAPPPAERVAGGWVTQTDTGARFELPDALLMERIVAARADALLTTPDEADPVELALTVHERCRLGEAAAPWVGRLRAAAVAIARGARRSASWDAHAALDAVADVLDRAGEVIGADDVNAIIRRLPPAAPDPPVAPEDVRLLAWIERRLVRWPADAGGPIDLLPGLPRDWAGHNVAVYGLRRRSATLGFAVRWHDERPALLWDLNERHPLTCRRLDPSWATDATRGETLLGPFTG